MTANPNITRIAAGAIALLTWTGLIVQFDASLKLTGPVLETLWIMLRFFTVIGNLLVAIVFTALALGHPVSPTRLGGVTVAILLIGVVYALLLSGMLELSGGAKLADVITHTLVPIVVPIYWLLLAPKGGLGSRDPLLWAVLPVGYFGYALARGAVEGVYAYPFLNVDKTGWSQTLVTALIMIAGFLAVGYAMLWIDRRLARR